MAAAWFNLFAWGNGEAKSCGAMPAESPDPLTIEAMAEVGIDISPAKPQAVTQRLLTQSDLIVVMGPDIYPNAFNPTHIWDFLDPTGDSIIHYRIQRDAIRRRVQEFVLELQSTVEEDKFDPIIAAALEEQLMAGCTSFS